MANGSIMSSQLEYRLGHQRLMNLSKRSLRISTFREIKIEKRPGIEENVVLNFPNNLLRTNF